MKRRVLLIDADAGFRNTLTQLLGGYRVAVVTETDPDRAIATAQEDAPDLLVIAVEEPEKAGFRAFQKARKMLATRLPIILVTSTMSPDSFAKHRSLKVHADEYINKRGVSNEELIGKIDNLIGLGDLQDVTVDIDDDIPLELADGDVVLDDHLDEQNSGPNRDFDVHLANTVGPNSSVTVDQMVSAETDAAFNMLMGDDAPYVPAPRSAETFEPGMEDSAIPEPLPHKIPDEESDVVDGVPQAAAVDVDSVPTPIDDGKLRDDFDGEHPTGADAEVSSEERDQAPPQSHEPSDAPAQRDSLSGIPLVDDDLVSLDDDVIEEVEEPADEPSGPVPQPIPSPINEPLAAAKEPSVGAAIPRIVGREPSPSAGLTQSPAPAHLETTVTREPIVVPESAHKSGAHPPVDLGLDVLAQDAEREQSGVYDRKSLRKIGELERQIAQLKTELERARAAADAADRGGGSRESQFIKLRETTMARETELKQVKTKLDQQGKDLVEAQEQLRQALSAKTALETKSAELDGEVAEARAKNKELAASLKDATAQASQLEQELDVKSRTAAAAEKALAQAEKDLTTERAHRAASASESERALRLDRDQLRARHKGELAMLRAETEAATELAIVRVREEVEVEKQRAVQEAIEETQRTAGQERAEAITVVETKHNAALLDIRRQHADALTAQKNELDVEIDTLKTAIIEAQASGVAAVAAVDGQHKSEIVRIQGDHDAALAALAETHAQAIGGLERKLDELTKAHDQEKAELESTHRHALADLRSRNNHEVAQLTESAKKQIETHRAELADEQTKHASLLAAANDTTEQQLAEQRALVRAANDELEQAKAKWAAEREEVQQAHASAIGELEARHERALAAATGEHQIAKAAAETAHRHAIDALKADADRMLRQLEAERDRNLEELQNERDELQKGLSGARDSLRQSQSELASAVQTIAERNHELREHAKAIAERDQRIAQLRAEIESIEQENANYQEQVLRAYQKIKSDEAMVARARKAMAIALTVLDDQGNPTSSSS